MGICNIAAEATTGLMNGAGANLLNALNLIAAADIAIRVGSGGRAGAGDLPGLTTERGIECYSPELGDTIYISPLQWYANGMSCSGLRDPDREALQRRIEELEAAAEARNRIRRNHDISLPPNIDSDIANALDKELIKNNALFNNGFLKPNGSLEFSSPGTLSLWQAFGSISVAEGGWVDVYGNWDKSLYEVPFFLLFPSLPTYSFQVQPGDKITKEIVSGQGQTFQRTDTIWSLTRGNYRIAKIENRNIEISQSWYGQAQPYKGHYSSRMVKVDGDRAKLDFKPTPPSPPTNNGIGGGIPINPLPPPEPPEEDNCMGGCSCGDIAQATRQNTRTMERLIEEIHRATNAGAFATGSYRFSPEQLIESQGRTIYAQNPGRGGTINAKNLFEATSALIAAHYHRMGLQRFPAKVPDNLIPKTGIAGLVDAVDGDTKDLQDMASFHQWAFEQWDAATGQYPIKFKVTDDGKIKDMFLWNQSEALAELFGMMTKVVEDADIGVQWGVRAATEAAGAKVTAYKALFAIKQLIEFSGALTADKWEDINLSFTPDPLGDSSKVEEMLKPKKQTVDVIDIVDGRSLMGLLLHISYYAQVAGLAVLGDTKPNPSTGQAVNIPGDAIREQRKKDKQQQSQFQKDWDKWKTKTKSGQGFRPTTGQSRGGFSKPDIQDIINTDPNRRP